MAEIVMIPSRFVKLTQEKHQHTVWFIYNLASKIIIDSSVGRVIRFPFNDVVSLYMGNGYEQTDGGECTYSKYNELRKETI